MHHMKRVVLAALWFALVLPAARADEEAIRPTARDIAGMSRVGDVRISPDGTRIVYTLTTKTFDKEAKPSEGDTKAGWKVEKQLWICAVREHDGEAATPRQLTRGDKGPRTPRWSRGLKRSPGGHSRVRRSPFDGSDSNNMFSSVFRGPPRSPIAGGAPVSGSKFGS